MFGNEFLIRNQNFFSRLCGPLKYFVVKTVVSAIIRKNYAQGFLPINYLFFEN